MNIPEPIETIDGLRALELLEKAVAERGAEYIYPDSEKNDEAQCQYQVDGRPSCLVGMALHLGGYPLPETNTSADCLDEVGLPVTHDAGQILLQAQNVQDHGAPWGAAFEAAQRAARNRGVQS